MFLPLSISHLDGIQKGKSHAPEEHFSGCLGRVVKLFDLNIGVAGNKLLTDKPYQEGFHARGKSNMASLSPLQDQIEDKVVVAKSSGTISNRKSKGTPMKVLIAQEMSKDINNKYNPPSVVAKLMGLDTLPSQQPDSSRQRDCAGGSARVHTDTQSSYCGDSRNGTLNAELCHEFHQYTEQNHCKDVYEVWQHPQKRSLRNKVSESRCVEKDKRIDYVRQKFLEAKFLSIDEKCHQTNQFRDTLEVLSSNTDLFLKFLQEPNPMFPQQISSLPSSPSPSDIKQITVLRPSKMVDNPTFSGKEMNEKQENKANQVSQLKRVDEIRLAHSASTASCSGDGNSTQLTRIVVLKPSTCKSHYLKDVNSSPYLPLAGLHHENVLEFPENKDAPESRELASEITLPRHKNYTGHERDGTLLSSESPDGYTSDESSFNRSENEHAMGNLCNSEVMSPASRHSWDFINRIRSPNSPFSPESPVSREAKKRLSERWAMVASNGVCQEPRPLWRSSSTLGEMLSLSDTNKSGKLEEGRDKEPRQLNSIQFRYPKMMEAGDNSPSKLLRSNFLPVSSTVFSSQLKAEISESEAVKTEPLEETINERSIKSSFKGRFSGLFSRNKKPSKQKVGISNSGDESHFGDKHLDFPGEVGYDVNHCLNNSGHEYLSPYVHGSSCKKTSSGLNEKQGISYSEVEPAPSVKRDMCSGNFNGNQDQPSPVSVLDTSFEEDGCIILHNFKPNGELPAHSVRSNLIDKSSPIGSIARTLAWDDSWLLDTATSFSLMPSSTQRTEKEREWFYYIQTILSEAGLDQVQYNSFISRWHSPESPLDPSLIDKYIDSHEEESLHEARKKERRSIRKLIFDCVNSVLMDITCQYTYPCNSVMLVDHVWEQMKEWFSWNMVCTSGYDEDGNSLIVENMVANEIVNKGWIHCWKLEWESIGKEIEGKLLEEMVREMIN
ncbi:unnamed protein product [Cuscuta epithymum]|uniref:DUF4378 domain-containing protein n=2 Tax=Cuscuta epithymum TaxID=186058 RepID=A0AAV0CD65_9ASTE|nr:unnamed protein product [Cuscuta epithymum]